MTFLQYSDLYYLISGIGLIFSPLLLLSARSGGAYLMRGSVILALTGVYLLGALRTAGGDYETYARAFRGEYDLIPDAGFRVLMEVFNSAGFPYQALMVAGALVTLYALKRMANAYGVPYAPLLLIYLCHLAIVRDLIQVRVGIAIAIIYLGITAQRASIRALVYLIAASLHLTSLALAVAYEYALWTSGIRRRGRRTLIQLIAICLILLLGMQIDNLAFVDDRIALYGAWESAGYRNPVGEFSFIYLHVAILALAFLTRNEWKENRSIRCLVLLQVLGVVVFLSFSGFELFAFRLGNVVLSMYPVLVIALLVRLKATIGGFRISKFVGSSILLAAGVVLLTRPGSFVILNSVAFS